MTRPTCMNCGKPLAKFTRSLWFRAPDSAHPLNRGEISAECHTREDVQRHTNEAVTVVKRDRNGRIYSAGTWDGLSYGFDGRGYFCTGSCAQSFGTCAAARMVAQRLRGG